MLTKQRQSMGQATVEFALCVTVFLMIVFGTVDFGRAIFMKTDLDNAVREGAHYGKLHPTESGNIVARVVSKASGTGLAAAGVTVSCGGGCTTGGTITVSATITFTAVTQSLLGISPFSLKSNATVQIE